MDNHDRQLIQENIDLIAKDIDFHQIVQLLLNEKIFTKSMIDHLECYPDPVRNIMVLSDLQSRGPKAFEKFIDILELTGSIVALKKVCSKRLINKFDSIHHPHYNNHQPTHTRANLHSPEAKSCHYQSQSEDRFKSEKGSIISSHDYYTSGNDAEGLNPQRNDTISLDNQATAELPVTLQWHPYSYTYKNQLSSLTSALENNLSIDSRTTSHGIQFSQSNHGSVESSVSVSRSSTLSNGASNTMTVKQAIECHDNLLEDYKMTANPRGPCLIINNINFDSDLFPERKGSEYDAIRLKDVFGQLGFEINHERNLTAKNMKKALKRVRARCRSIDDALIIIILSHGSESGIYGSDGIELDFNYMIDLFDNRHCKAMIGKPKIFIVQACRGRLADYGGNDSSESSPSRSSADESIHSEEKSRSRAYRERLPPFKRVNKFSKDKLPTRTDMLFCFSCLPGYVSVRNEVAGSWLGVSLSYYLITESWDKDILRILAMVSGDIKGRISSEGHVEAVETTCLGWSKNLYFNPGIYKI